MPDQPPSFYTISLLYRRTSTSGRTVYVGTLDGVRIYMLPSDRSGDNAPEWELAVRVEDWTPATRLLKKGK